MTDSKSIEQLKQLLVLLPGVVDANVRRSDDAATIKAIVHCASLAGFDAIARCASGANVLVTLGQSEASTFRKLTPVPFLKCCIQFRDDETERPSECERFGFYAAAFLYNESLVDDSLLDVLETEWHVDFSRNRG